MRIADLRKKLNELECQWTSEDEKYMGKFEDQEIVVPVFRWNKPVRYDPAGAFDFAGYSRDVWVYWDITGLGLCVECDPRIPI